MKKIIFSSAKNLEVPAHNLNEIQIESFKWWQEKGLKELFEEISPIKDYTGKEFELYFNDYHFDEPKYSEREARENGTTYQASLRVNCTLINHVAKEKKEQEVYLGEYPLITEKGIFIINGVGRVVVSQIIRSSGVYFVATPTRDKKLFGAKIIPNRGCWLEFETENDGVIYVRIDKKRKIPATALLRVFGLVTNEEILKRFSDVDKGSIKYIERTLKKDASFDENSAYVEIYKRVRPGDLATPENAGNLIKGMFFRFDRYDLEKVGRYKINQRLNLNFPLDQEHRLLNLEDLVAVLKEIIRLNNDPSAEPDDIDHLSNRRIKTVGELLVNRCRVGLARIRRIVQDRMSTSDPYTLLPSRLINHRQLESVVRNFFTLSSLSQFMNQVNPLSSLEHKRRITAIGPGGLVRKRAGFEVRDVHPSYCGRICPIETPEGLNIGLVNHLAIFARLNDFSFLITPYLKVEKGKVTKKKLWLEAIEEEKYFITHQGVKRNEKNEIKEEIVEVRYQKEATETRKDKVDLIEVAPYQILSLSACLIPFLEHNDANRALMGSNMQRQAVPCLFPDPPLVGTGLEEKAALDSGDLIKADEDGEIIEVDASHITLKTKNNKIINYQLEKFVRTNDYTCFNQMPKVNVGDKVKKGDVLCQTNSIGDNMLSLGKNLLVAYLPWKGMNFEDAVVISERLVKEDIFTSIHIEDFKCDVRETKLGPEINTPDIPGVSEERLKDLDEEGIIRVGAEVKPGDILVGKISPKGEVELTPEERLLQAIFGEKIKDVKDTSLTLPASKRGRVVGVKIFSREAGYPLEPGVIKRIQVEVAQMRKISEGDKLAGRHGNKGVIAKILPEEDMPFLADGTPIDIILNPLSVASRMNLGQILETHLGLVAKKLNFRAVSPPLAGAKDEEIRSKFKEAGFPEDGKFVLFDSETGEPAEKRVTVGYGYIMKLNHLVEDKIHMRSIGPYSLVTQQPLGGKARMGGQRFGEMEVWALEAYGAAYTLQEMLTIKSDDIKGRAKTYEKIVKNEKIETPFIPVSFNVLVNELRALGFSVEIERSENNT